MEVKTLCLVMRTANYQDSDRMLTLFSREHGRIDALARGCRKQGSPLLATCDSFCCSEFLLKKKGDRYYVASGELKQNFFALRSNMRGLMTAALLLDVCEKVVMPGQGSPKLFSLIVNALFALNGGTDAEVVFNYFVFKLLEFEGLKPDLDVCAVCGKPARDRFSVYDGGAVCSQCGGVQLPAGTLENLKAFVALPPKGMGEGKLKTSGELLDISKDLLVKFLEFRPRSMDLFESVVRY